MTVPLRRRGHAVDRGSDRTVHRTRSPRPASGPRGSNRLHRDTTGQSWRPCCSRRPAGRASPPLRFRGLAVGQGASAPARSSPAPSPAAPAGQHPSGTRRLPGIATVRCRTSLRRRRQAGAETARKSGRTRRAWERSAGSIRRTNGSAAGLRCARKSLSDYGASTPYPNWRPPRGSDSRWESFASPTLRARLFRAAAKSSESCSCKS